MSHAIPIIVTAVSISKTTQSIQKSYSVYFPADSSMTTNITDSCSMPDQTLFPINKQRESDFYLVKLVDSDAPSTSSAAASAEAEAEAEAQAPLLFSPSYLGRRKCKYKMRSRNLDSVCKIMEKAKMMPIST